MNSLKDDLKRLRELKDTYRALYNEADAVKAEHNDLQAQLFQQVREIGLDNVKFEGTRYQPVSTIYAVVQDLDQFVEWAKRHNEDELFLKVEPAKGRLNELVRNAIDNGEEPPPGLGFYTTEYISITKENK